MAQHKRKDLKVNNEINMFSNTKMGGPFEVAQMQQNQQNVIGAQTLAHQRVQKYKREHRANPQKKQARREISVPPPAQHVPPAYPMRQMNAVRGRFSALQPEESTTNFRQKYKDQYRSVDNARFSNVQPVNSLPKIKSYSPLKKINEKTKKKVKELPANQNDIFDRDIVNIVEPPKYINKEL